MKMWVCKFWFFGLMGLSLMTFRLWAEARISAKGNFVIAETRNYRAVFEGGVLRSLENRLTGEQYSQRNKAAIKPLTALRFLGNEGLATGNFGRVASVKITKLTENSVEVAFLRLPSQSGIEIEGSLRMGLSIEPDSGDLIISLQGEAEKSGLYSISWGIEGLRDSLSLIVPGYSGVKIDKSVSQPRIDFVFPFSWEAYLAIIQGKRGGFAVWTQEEDFRFNSLHFERDKNNKFGLSFETQNPAPFDELREIKSIQWRLNTYRGDWTIPARRYRNWLEAAYNLKPLERQTPSWAREIKFCVIMGLERGILDELKKHVPPQNTLLYIPGWRKDDYDRNYPDYTASEGFGAFVQYAHSLGFKVMVHVNYFGCDPKNPLYEQFKKYQIRDPFNKEPQWWTWEKAERPIKFAYINPASREWRKILVERFKEIYDKHKIDALHLDQTLCLYNDANGLIDGMSCVEGNLELHKELKEALPEVALSGEGLNQVTFRYEAFAQCHGWGIDWVEGKWNEELIACGHPIRSFLFAPYTTSYGYLGMRNPDDVEIFQAVMRDYENFGVIPTLGFPDLNQFKKPSVNFKNLLAVAKFFCQEQLVPDWESPWGEGVVFAYKTKAGQRAAYKRDNNGLALVKIEEKEKEIYRRIEGVHRAWVPGTIPNWLAYDSQKIIGLEPGKSYPYLDVPRDERQFHITSLPEGVIISQARRTEEAIVCRLKDISQDYADLVKLVFQAKTGYQIKDHPPEVFQGAFSDQESGSCFLPEGKDKIFAHPPWKPLRAKEGPDTVMAGGQGFTFAEYRLKLPLSGKVCLKMGMGLKEGAEGKSDGVTYRVLVKMGGRMKKLFEEQYAKKEAKEIEVDLSEFKNKEIILRLEIGPGKAKDVSFDWALVHEPKICWVGESKRSLEFVSPKKLVNLVSERGQVDWIYCRSQEGLHLYQAEVLVPDKLCFLFKSGQPINLPSNLTELKFQSTTMTYAGLQGEPEGFVGGRVGMGTCGGATKRGLWAHPPNQGLSFLDYLIQLPDQKPIYLKFYMGIQDGAKSNGAIFALEVNGQRLLENKIMPETGWHEGEIDLSSYGGKTVLLSFITDSAGDYFCDWAIWGEPTIYR